MGGPVVPLGFPQHHPQEHAGVDKRTQITESVNLERGQCLYPPSGVGLDQDDCSKVCNAINGYTSPVIVGPRDIETWTVGTCTFGVANLQNCDTLEITPLSLFTDACYNLVSGCIANGYEAIQFGGPPSFAISIYAQPAAPPYAPPPDYC